MSHASVSVLIHAPVSAVWQRLQNFSAWPDWMPDISKVTLLETAKAGAIGRLHLRTGDETFFKILEVQHGSHLRWQTRDALATTLSREYRLTRNAEGAILTIETRFSGQFARMLFPLREKRLTQALAEQAESLKGLTEEPPAPIAFCLKWSNRRNSAA